MYLPGNLSLCEPHVHTWVGASGRRYDFAVARPATTWLDEAAVFLLVKRAGSEVTVLYIGHTQSLHRRFGHASQRCPEIWRQALAAGMTHVHLRFEACSERERHAEVLDLRGALQPSIDDPQRPEEELGAPSLAAPAPAPAVPAPSAAGDDVLVLYRAKLKPTRHRDPHVDVDAFDADARRGDLPIGHAFEAPRGQRADPAREPSPDDAVAIGEEATLADRGSNGYLVSDRLWVNSPEAVPDQVVAEVVEPAATEPGAVSAEATQGEESDAKAPAAPHASHGFATQREVDPDVGDGSPANRGPGLLLFLARLAGVAAAWRRRWVARASAPLGLVSSVERAPAVALPAAAEALDRQGGAAGRPAVPPAEVNQTGQPADLSSAPPSSAGPTARPADADEAAVSIGAASPAPEPDDAPPSPDSKRTALQGEAATRCEVADDICRAAPAEAAATKGELGFDPAAPLALFAGAISYEAGADIIVDAVLTVCGTDASAQFVFAGEGPLHAELEGRVVGRGLGHRCRFVGHVPAGRFHRLLDACDFVVIPARVEQGEALAQLALAAGKPALVSQQSGVRCVLHGHNGLVTYDNPGSFVWGIREMLGPLRGKLMPRPAEAA